MTSQPVRAHMWVDDAWMDVTDDLRLDPPIAIKYGIPDEATTADPVEVAVQMDARDGRYSPRNPRSDLYGKIGKNTPLRIALANAEPHLLMPGTAGAIASAPDAVALGITGDLDIRVDVTLPNWPALYGLAAKYATVGNQRSWSMLTFRGLVQLYWSPDGTLASRVVVTSTERVVPPASGRLALRVTLDVNNGSGGNTVTFFTSDSISGSWTQLGSPVVTPGTTSVFDSTAAVEIGNTGIDAELLLGHVHALELRSGIGGTVVASPNFTAQTPGAASFADAQGNTWTMAGGAEISNLDVRASVEASSLPITWDLGETDVTVPIAAGGILRRLGQGQPALASALRRGLESASDLVSYWPAEDGFGARSIASALSGTPSMKAVPLPNFGGDASFLCSKPLPTVQNSEWSADVPVYATTGQTQVRFLLHVAPTASAAQSLCTVYTTGTCYRWRLAYESGGALSLRGYDTAGTELFNSGNVAFAVDGKLMRISIELTQSGSDVNWAIVTLEDVGGFVFSGTLTGRTVGRAVKIVMNEGGAVASGDNRVTLGHISLQNAISSIYDFRDQFNAYVGERAGSRIARLCAEEGVPLVSRGYPDETMPMGAQARDTFLNLVSQAAAADGGLLGEDRGRLGLAWTSRQALYNQAATVTLDYAAGDISEPFQPVEDDQEPTNDLTVNRVNGSSARYQQTEGRNSVFRPPLGIGRYPNSLDLNVAADSVLKDIASWKVHVSTWDEARYPQVVVDLLANPQLTDAVQAVSSGHVLVVDNPPAWLPPESPLLMVRGYEEEIGEVERKLTYNTVPAGPYNKVAVYGQSRYDTAGSELAVGIDSDDVTLSVSTTSGPIWTTTDVPFDILVGGERMTVTAVSGASSPQSFTVTRSVNGIVKSHAAATAVSLADPSVYAL